jgi:hypothetical protein
LAWLRARDNFFGMARKRMPRSPIEKDSNRPMIERALAMGIPMKRVAERYGHSVGAVHRFRERMPQQLKGGDHRRHVAARD